MEISLVGFHENVATFQAEEGVVAPMPVKMTGNGTVGPCDAGDAFCGVAVNVRGGFAAVQLSGYTQATYTGTAPAVGYQTMSAAGSGAVQTGAAGRSILITDVDPAANLCGMIL